MTSPLSVYKETADNLGYTDDLLVEDVAKLSFAREQANQMKMIANRLFFDITIAKLQLEGASDDETKAAYQNKINEYEKDLRQTRRGLVVSQQLLQELEAVVAE